MSFNKKSNNKKILDIDTENVDNSNFDNNNFNYPYFGKKYINLIKRNGEEKNDIIKYINKHEDKYKEKGHPLLSSDNFYEVESEPIKTSLQINNMKKNNIELENKKINEKFKYKKNINKAIILNKMRNNKINLPKKKLEKNKEINKLYNLIKNSCYNLNKLSYKKCTKSIKNNSNIIKINKKINEINSIDVNNEISRNIENEPSNLYPKEFFNKNLNGENKLYKKKILIQILIVILKTIKLIL